MGMTNAMCTGCNAGIQLDDKKKTAFCMYCGARILVAEAIDNYRRNTDETAPVALETNDAISGAPDIAGVDRLLAQNSFTKAENICNELLSLNSEDWEARWRLIRARTRDLETKRLDLPEDFLWSEAMELFARARVPQVESWRSAYLDAYMASCSETAGSYDPRVFIELSVYRWNIRENRFESPIDRSFPIELHVDKNVRIHLNKLSAVLTGERKAEFDREIDRTCGGIAAYFRSGFESLDELRNGNFKKLFGLWAVQNADDSLKTEAIRVSKNDAGVVYCENIRTTISRLDYARFVGMDTSGSLTCRELRRYPSQSGAGGDFLRFPQPRAFQTVFALYDHLLILPNGIFRRSEPAEVPGYDKALAFQQKCYKSPCFIRDGKRSIQIRPSSENHNTAEPSKKVSSCYIATAVYGNVDEPHVLALRRFRDDVLNRSRLGRRVSSAYYRLSPPLAERLRDAKAANTLVRALLNVFVAALRLFERNK